MIIYNVTINVEDVVHNDWLSYMKNEHIPDVLKTGCFVGHTFSRIITKHEGETGTSYSIQYKCANMEKYHEYQENFAPKLKQEVIDKFEGKFFAFRTLLEEVE